MLLSRAECGAEVTANTHSVFTTQSLGMVDVVLALRGEVGLKGNKAVCWCCVEWQQLKPPGFFSGKSKRQSLFLTAGGFLSTVPLAVVLFLHTKPHIHTTPNHSQLLFVNQS